MSQKVNADSYRLELIQDRDQFLICPVFFSMSLLQMTPKSHVEHRGAAFSTCALCDLLQL